MEWIITAKVKGKKGYKVFEAYDELPFIDWRKSKVTKNVSTGDIVYIYVGKPYQKIMLKMNCTNSIILPKDMIYDNKYYNNPTVWEQPKEAFRLEKIDMIDTDALSLKRLNDIELVEGNIQGSRRCDKNPQLFKYINNCFNNPINNEYDELCKELESIDNKYKDTMWKSRIGQGKYREGIILKHGCKCMICDITTKDLLIASHIKRFSLSTKKESIDLNNGLLLCANHDKLFDQYLISFDNTGKIIISNIISESEHKHLNINESLYIKTTKELERYMSHHRKLMEKKRTP